MICGESFTFRYSPKAHSTETMRCLDSTTLRCYLRAEAHEIHHARADIIELGKTIFVSWGKGKPRIIETSLTVISQSPQSTSE